MTGIVEPEPHGRGFRPIVVVAVTAAAASASVVDEAERLAGGGEHLRGVAVAGPAGFDEPSGRAVRGIGQRVTDLGGRFHELLADDVAQSLASFARAEGASIIVIGATGVRRPRRSVGARLEQLVDEGTSIVIVGTNRPGRRFRHTAPAAPGLAVSRGRQVGGLLIALITLPLLTVVLARSRGQHSEVIVFLVYLMLVVALAGVGGPAVGVVSAVAAFLLVNWFFTEPLHTLNVAEPEKVVELIIFLAVSGTVAALVSTAARRAQLALRLRAQATLLARAAGTALVESNPTAALLDELASAVGARRIQLIDSDTPFDPAAGERIELLDGRDFAIEGGRLDADSRLLVRAFGDQVTGALRRRELADQAANAEQLRATNELRSALLRAVSHDLRTPLATAKISTSSLLASDVEWDPATRDELLRTADGEIDRLIRIVENLLDAGRLQAGAIDAKPGPTAIEPVVLAAVQSLDTNDRLRITAMAVSPSAVGVADHALLERVVANLLANALAADPVGAIEIETGEEADRIEIRVIDHGPGIPAERRTAILLPFQRYTDQSTAAGVGLGLSICAGFCAAMGVSMRFDDTPGGGATVTLSLATAGLEAS